MYSPWETKYLLRHRWLCSNTFVASVSELPSGTAQQIHKKTGFIAYITGCSLCLDYLFLFLPPWKRGICWSQLRLGASGDDMEFVSNHIIVISKIFIWCFILHYFPFKFSFYSHDRKGR